MIIAIEGLDSSGKFTQAKKLAAAISAVYFDFPHYDSPSGILISKLLKGEITVGSADHNDWALLLQTVMTLNRLEYQPMLAKYCHSLEHHIVLDRYYASGIVYGEADGLGRDYLTQLHRQLLPADIWLFIDISVDESFKRRPVRRDKYEERRDLLTSVRLGYMKLFTEEPKLFPGVWEVIPGQQADTEVHNDIMAKLREHKII